MASKFFFLVSLCLLIFVSDAFSNQVSDIAVIPEQVHITLADRPNSILVQWVTMKPIDVDAFVEYGKQKDNLDRKQSATVELFIFNNVKRYMYTAEMTQLDYESTYCK